jgi:hypothetical protein
VTLLGRNTKFELPIASSDAGLSAPIVFRS